MMIMQCDYFQNAICKSCSLLPMTYEQSLGIRFMQRLFPFVSIEDFRGVTNAAGSRIRAKLAVSGSVESPQIGFGTICEASSQRNSVLCIILRSTHTSSPLKQLIREAKLIPYDVVSRRPRRAEVCCANMVSDARTADAATSPPFTRVDRSHSKFLATRTSQPMD